MTWIAQLVPEHGGVLLWAHLVGLMLIVSLLAWLAATIFAQRHAPRRRLIYVSALIVLLAGPVVVVAARGAGFAVLRVPVPASWIRSRHATGSGDAVPRKPPPRAPERLTPPAWAAPRWTPGLPDEGPANTSTHRVNQRRQPATATVAMRAGLGVALVIWLAGALLLLLRLLAGWHALRRLQLGLEPVARAEMRPILRRVASALGTPRLPRIYVSDALVTPVVLGLWRPVVVLPRHLLRSLPPDQQTAVLVHECAHVANRDHLVRLLQRTAEVVYWPLPFVWWLSRALTAAAEDVCDNHALRNLAPERYALTLVDVAEETPSPTRLATASGLGLSGGSLKERILGILDQRRNTVTKNNRWVVLSISAACFLIAGILACVGTEPAADAQTLRPRQAPAAKAPALAKRSKLQQRLAELKQQMATLKKQLAALKRGKRQKSQRDQLRNQRRLMRKAHRLMRLQHRQLLRNKQPKLRGQQRKLFGKQRKLFGKQRKLFGKQRKLFGKKWKLYGKKWKLFGKKWKLFGKKWKLYGKKWKLYGKKWKKWSVELRKRMKKFQQLQVPPLPPMPSPRLPMPSPLPPMPSPPPLP